MVDVVSLLDASIYRPDVTEDYVITDMFQKEICPRKEKRFFRDYTVDVNDRIKERVRQTYIKLHTYQTVEFVTGQIKKWCKFDTAKMTVIEALEKLNAVVDESDPDVDVPNIVHAFQTAESIRASYPGQEYGWFHLTGLIHDLGKVMALYGAEQWAVTGDTFPVGCAYGDSIVYRNTSFVNNPDLIHPIYSTKNGIYGERCGLNNVLMSWGHDEYMYRVLMRNGSTLPPQALYMVRFHSFYPWHTGGDYFHLCDDTDLQMLKWIREFNKFDLYTKADAEPDLKALWPYYQSLVDQYIPGVLEW